MQLDLIERPTITRASEAARRMRDAKLRAERGMNQAESSAERSAPGWCAAAVEAIRRFASANAGVFSVEQMRSVIEAELPSISDRRAWGKATVMAVKANVIERVPRVYLPAASSNGAPKPAWRRKS